MVPECGFYFAGIRFVSSLRGNVLVCGMSAFSERTRSPLSQSYSDGDITVHVEIYKIHGSEGWTLELVEEDGKTTTWDDTFATDHDALDEFRDGVELLGLTTLIDSDQDDFSTVH